MGFVQVENRIFFCYTYQYIVVDIYTHTEVNNCFSIYHTS